MTNQEKINGRQWDLVNFCEQFWHEEKAFPSQEVIANNLSEHYMQGRDSSPGTVQAIYEQIEEDILRVRKFLDNRGISYVLRNEPVNGSKLQEGEGAALNSGSHRAAPNQLTDKQLAVAHTLLNPFDRRSLEGKLRELGVSPNTYYGWLKSEIFAQYMKRRSEELFGDTMPMAHSALMRNVIGGDVKSLKLFYEMTNRWQGVKSQDTGNLRAVIMQLIEVIQKHVNDPETLKAIARDFQQALDTQQAVNSAVNAAHSPIGNIYAEHIAIES